MGKAKLISIVVPTHNEEDNIYELHKRISLVFENMGGYVFELIFIDDSIDETPVIISQLVKDDKHVKMIRLVRSFGQALAIAAGIKRAAGDAVIMMDADLQDPPEVIPEMIKKWESGSKVVYVERVSSSRSFMYKIFAWLFYRILAGISSTRIPLDAGEFRLIDRVVVNFIKNLKERSRFMRGLTVWPGYSIDKIKINRSERFSGKTNYNFSKSLAVAFDGIISFSIIPLRIATIIGFFLSLGSLFVGVYNLTKWIINREAFGAGYMTMVILIAGIGGMNLIGLGIVGEYIGRIFLEIQGRPLYLVDYELGWNNDKVDDEN